MSADEKKKWRGLANANAKSRLEKSRLEKEFADTQASSNFVPAADGAGEGVEAAMLCDIGQRALFRGQRGQHEVGGAVGRLRGAGHGHASAKRDHRRSKAAHAQ